ncbi:MAG TPA: hypothetical protein VLS27_08540, partial [Gammaproteobacteria bacterium]|nr:hypothetical protein [Gammaproteobacteria bacterium]
MRERVRSAGWVAAAMSLLSLGACGEGGSGEAATPDGVVRRARSGPVEVTLRVKPEELELGSRAQMQVEVTAERGATVEVNDLRTAAADGERRFEYRVERTAERIATPMVNGRLQWTYEYSVAFFLPGDYELPRVRVRYRAEGARQVGDVDASAEDADASSQDDWQEVATEPVTVTVRDPHTAPLTPEELQEVSTLDPVALPSPWARWWWAGPVAAVVVAALAVLMWRRARHKRASQEPVIPADVWARQQIAALIAEDLVSRGLVQTFYYRLSDVVRGYIERRFSISAPEMTTEEFLAAASSDTRFDSRHTEQLDRFLGACDLVKYARHEPGASEIDGMLNEAKRFIE